MWFSILQFLNIVGVVSNAFMVAFTSNWGLGWAKTGGLVAQLWVVVFFEVNKKLKPVRLPKFSMIK